MILLKKPTIIACIPAFNEERTLPLLIPTCKKYTDKIFVCDDGSTDLTYDIAKRLGAEVVKHERNLGKGVALQTLFKLALNNGADVVVTLDADGAHNPEDIPLLLEPILKQNPNVDVVIGSRFMKSGFGPVSRLNFVGNKLINALIFMCTGRLLSDSQSGFRAFRRWVLESMDLIADGYEVESELTIKCVKMHRCKIVEVPIKCKRIFKVSKLNALRDGLKILQTILKTVCLGVEDRD